MTTEGIFTLILGVSGIVMIVHLGLELQKTQRKLNEKAATADAYDRAACEHNARANKAEKKYCELLQAASTLGVLAIQLIERIEELEAKISQKHRKRGPGGRFAKADAVAKD